MKINMRWNDWVMLPIVFLLFLIGVFRLSAQQNPIQIDANGLTQTLAAGGIVNRGQIVKINSSGQVVPVLTTDTAGAIGIAATAQQNVGQSISVSLQGSPLVQIDASGCTAGNIVSISTTTAGAGHCAATAVGQQVGVAISISSPGSNFWNVALSLGGGGGAAPNTAVPANVFSVKNFGAIGDAQHIKDGSTTGVGARNTVTSATAHFLTHAKVNQNIVCSISGNSTPGMPISTITAVTSDTVVTTNGTDAGTISNLICVWWTPSASGDDTAAFQAAATAATPTATSVDPNTGATLGTPPGTVYCPSGGYAVKGRIINFVGVGATTSPSFKGDQGKNHCIIYMIPGMVDPGDGLAVLVSSFSNIGFDMEDIVIDGLGFGFAFSHPIVQCQSCTQFTIKRVKITNTSTSGTGNGTIDFRGSSLGTTEDVLVQGGGSGNDFACSFPGSANGIVNRAMECSNHFQNLLVDNGGAVPRSIAGDNGITFIGGLSDECGVANCAVISNGGLANFHDFTLMTSATPSNYALSVDGTSRAYLNNVSCGIFGSTTGTANCMTIASGGFVASTNSDLRGNDANSTAGVAVNGPAGATFADLGGNKILHSVSAVISPVTPAQYTTLGFTGGIVPKATVTHTPNTCYAVTGNLLATAQNICTLLLDQNYQVVNITAQSGGTTPANSSCTGAPVITLSDGTRTGTLTMTTGKTQWSSAVDVSTVNNVFASGATLTVSIGANTCATPPSNVSVNYVLQSVLNP